MKVYDAVARALARENVQTIFGLMGDANMRHLISFIEAGTGEFVSAVDEGGAVSMADGYARVSGRVGVASVTHGPGITNTLTALTEAVRASGRVVVLTGDTPARPDHLQRLDLRAAAALTGAEYHRVLTADRCEHDVRTALRRVAVTSRPIVLDVPVDIDGQDFSGDSSITDVQAARPGASPVDLDRALGIMATARRPVILAGRGAVEAREQLIELSRILGAPVATTLLAQGLFDGIKANLGIAGNLGTAVGVEAIWSADCVIAFGASLNKYTTIEGSLFDGRAVIQVDNRAENIGVLATPNAPVFGDAMVVAETMTEQLDALGLESELWLSAETLQSLDSQQPADEFDDASDGSTLDARTAMIELDRLLPVDRQVVTDTGRFVYAPWRFLKVNHPSRFVHTLNFASIGLGLATAVGAAVAAPDQLTVAVVGDGGGMMGMTHLVTAVQRQLPLLVVVCNDSAYGMEYHALLNSGANPDHSKLNWPEFSEVARGFGAGGTAVRTVAELHEAVRTWAERPTGPYVIDIKTDPGVDVAP